jgi:hypothetical protein
MKEYSARQLKKKIFHKPQIIPSHVLRVLPALLDKQTSLSADEVIGEVIDTYNVFIPITVGPFGEFCSLFRRFIETHKTLTLPTFSSDRPNATPAAALAVTNRTPYNVLGKADTIWKETHGSNSLMEATCHSPPVHGLING